MTRRTLDLVVKCQKMYGNMQGYEVPTGDEIIEIAVEDFYNHLKSLYNETPKKISR